MNKTQNEYEYFENYAEIKLIKDSKLLTKVKVSIEDVEDVKKYTWRLDKIGYISGCINGKRMYLHRYLLNNPQNGVVDHINRNPLDNRRENIRNVSHSVNSRNTDKFATNTSGFKNLAYNVKTGYWRGELRLRGKRYRTSRYRDKEKALAALIMLKERIGYDE